MKFLPSLSIQKLMQLYGAKCLLQFMLMKICTFKQLELVGKLLEFIITTLLGKLDLRENLLL